MPVTSNSGGHTARATGGGGGYGRVRYDASEDPQDRDLRQLLQLAQLHQMTVAPEQEQQQIDQRDQQARLAAAIQLLGLQQETTNQGEARRIQERGIDETAQARKGAMLEGLSGDMIRTGQVPLSTIAETLRKGGYGELADTLDVVHKGEVNKNIQTHLGQLGNITDPKAKNTYLQSISDPDVLAGVRQGLPVTAPTAPEVSAGAKWGNMLRGLININDQVGPDPLTTAFRFGARAGTDYKKQHPEAVNDFWNALLNKSQPTY